MAMQLGDEFLGVQRGFRPRAGIEQAIDDQQAGLMAADFPAQQFHHFVQPLLLHGVESTDELQLRADFRRIEKAQGRQVLEQTLVGLAQQRRHQHPSAVRHMVERQLIGQDGLA
ncbi:hypothetical protein D3C79_561490 [compost metagenome]